MAIKEAKGEIILLGDFNTYYLFNIGWKAYSQRRIGGMLAG